MKKLAAALAAGLAFPVLDLSGYTPGAETQAPAAVWTLRLLYVGVPTFCNVLAVLIAWRYPIGRELHERIRAEIEEKALAPASAVLGQA